MIFLIDNHLEGHTQILIGNIASQGWFELLSLRFVTLREVNLPVDSSDRVVWQLAQSNQMILLTANRRMKGKDSLEQVIREENTSTSLPVITIGNPERLLEEADYRNKCVDRLLEIVIDLENYYGVGRLFMP